MTSDADPPFRWLCREGESGLTGEFVADDEGIRLKLVRYDGRWFSGETKDIGVQLENGDVATLFDCVPISWGQVAFETHVNQALIGRRPWTTDDRVKLLTFSFWNGRQALHYADHMTFEHDDSSEHPFNHFVPRVDFSKLQIFEAVTDVATISVQLDAKLKFDRFRSGPEFRPLVAIEFVEPQGLDSAHRLASHVLTFFEMSSGRKSRLLDMMVSTQSLAELASAEEKFPSHNFKLRLPYGAWEAEKIRDIPCALFSVFDVPDREATRRALEKWVSRLAEWEPAYALLSGYLSNRNQFDRDRLLRLAAWFEAMPLADTRTDVSAAQRTAIVAAAQASADQQGRPDLSDRIRELLGGLSRKALKARLEGARERAASRFGASVPESTAVDLVHFAKLRNDAAHGRIAMSGDNAARDIRAIRAAELICLLSLLSDLELPSSVSGSIGTHSLGAYSIFQ